MDFFPAEFKISRVVPVYKKGEKDKPSYSYRPISIIPVFAEIFEVPSNLYLQLHSYFERNKLLSESQHGFRKQIHSWCYR